MLMFWLFVQLFFFQIFFSLCLCDDDDLPLAEERLFWCEHDWLNYFAVLLSVILSHEWRVIAPFLSLPFLVNKHRPQIHPAKILNFFSVPPSPFISSVNPPLHPSIPPPSSPPPSLPIFPVCPSLSAGLLAGMGCAEQHVCTWMNNCTLNYSPQLSFLPLSFWVFFWLLTLALCSYEGAVSLSLVQGNSGDLTHLSFESQSFNLSLLQPLLRGCQLHTYIHQVL